MNNEVPKLNEKPCQKFNKLESQVIADEIIKLIEQRIIVEVPFSDKLVISPIFLVEKSNGGHRMILNLKKLNEFVPYIHFKMETFEHALTLVTPDIYMASLDIRNAYYSIPIDKSYQRFLTFKFEEKFYSFTCLPNGLSTGPYIFTRIMKPILSNLRKQGFKNSAFIDDSFLLGETKKLCRRNVDSTEYLLKQAGFDINYDKSVKEPTQIILHLGNIIDSAKMIVTLPETKIAIIIQECKSLISVQTTSIRLVARVIGLLVASFSAVQYGRLHYRRLERRKIEALSKAKGNFSKRMQIDQQMKAELLWWIKNVKYQIRVIDRKQVDLTVVTDSSTVGWGCQFNEISFNGKWNTSESKLHINALELLAIWMSLRAIRSTICNKNIVVMSDSTTAVSYINNMGGLKSLCCDKIARDIWSLCISINTWITCSYIPGVENAADEASRVFQDRHEWGIDECTFDKLCRLWGHPNIDLFASRLNAKLKIFCSWRPDPEASYIDAFTLNWNEFDYNYVFPPFSLLPRILQKIEAERAEALVVAPLWPTQLWWPKLMSLLIDLPRILTNAVLTKPPDKKPHPLAAKMLLIGVRVSGCGTKRWAFHNALPNSSLDHGENQLSSNINHILKHGFSSVVQEKLIHFILI